MSKTDTLLKIKSLLDETMRLSSSLSDNSKVSEVRSHVRLAAAKMEKVLKEQVKRKEFSMPSKEIDVPKDMTPKEARGAIEYLDSLIEQETKKLEELGKQAQGGENSLLAG